MAVSAELSGLFGAPGGGEKLGIAVVEIGADMAKYEKGVDTAHSKLKTFDENAAKSAKKIGMALTTAGVLITGSLLASVNAAVEFGDQMDKASRRTNMTAEDLSGLAYAADISGTRFETLEGSLRRFTDGIGQVMMGTGEAKVWFDKLGISVVDAAGVVRSTTELFLEAADAIAGMSNETEQVIATQEIFGSRYGTQILPLLKEGSSGIKALTDRAAELGLVMSTDAAAAAAEFKDRMTDLKGSLASIGREVGSALIPVLLPLVESLTDVAVRMRRWGEEHPELNRQLSTFALTVGGLTLAGGPLLMLAPQLLKAATAIKALGFSASTSIPLIGGLALATWGLVEAIQYYQKPFDTLADRQKVVKERTEQLQEAVGSLAGSLQVYAQTGDEASATLGDLEINTKLLSKELGIMVDENTNAAELLEKLRKAFYNYVETHERAAEEIKKSTDAQEGFNDTIKAIPWEEVSKGFQEWSDITGAGYQANLLAIRDYWQDRLAEAEKGSKEEMAIQRTIADTEAKLADERYAGWMEVSRINTAELKKRELTVEDSLERTLKIAVTKGTEMMGLIEAGKSKELEIVRKGEDGKFKVAAINMENMLKAGKDNAEKMFKTLKDAQEKEFKAILEYNKKTEEAELGRIAAEEKALEETNKFREQDRKQLQADQKEREELVKNAINKLIDAKELELRKTKALYDSEKEYNLARKIAIIQIYNDIIATAEEAGMDIVALEQWKKQQLEKLDKDIEENEIKSYERRLKSQKSFMELYVDTTADGINATANAWADLWSIWHNTEMTSDKFYSSSIGKLAVWVDRVNSLVNNAKTAWNSLNTVIAAVGKLMGTTGAGGAVSALGQAAPTAVGGASMLGKLGGVVKGIAGAVAGLPWGTIGGAAAGLAPAAVASLFTAGVFGFMAKGILGDIFGGGRATTGTVDITRTQEDWLRLWEQQQRDEEIRYQQAQQFSEGQREREQMQLELARYSLDELKRIYEIFPELRTYMQKTWEDVERRGIAGGRYGQATGEGVTIQAGVIVADEYSLDQLAEKLAPMLKSRGL